MKNVIPALLLIALSQQACLSSLPKAFTIDNNTIKERVPLENQSTYEAAAIACGTQVTTNVRWDSAKNWITVVSGVLALTAGFLADDFENASKYIAFGSGIGVFIGQSFGAVMVDIEKAQEDAHFYNEGILKIQQGQIEEALPLFNKCRN